MALFEAPEASWESRLNASHYSYRDSHSATALVFPGVPPIITPEQQELALLATEAVAGVPGTVYYPFGYNARNNADTGAIGRWPNLGDYGYTTQSLVPRGQCYARAIKITAEEDTWIRFISLNPLYTVLINQLYSVDLIASWDISSTIIEVEQWVGAGDTVTFYPTYAVALVYRANTANGTIYIAVEGNVEGGE